MYFPIIVFCPSGSFSYEIQGLQGCKAGDCSLVGCDTVHY